MLPRRHKEGEEFSLRVSLEHRLRELFRVATRVMALSYGEKLIEGDAATVIEHPKVKEAYLGSEETLS